MVSFNLALVVTSLIVISIHVSSCEVEVEVVYFTFQRTHLL